MRTQLIQILLRVVHSTEVMPSVGAGKTIDAFCRDYHLGRRKGSRWVFTAAQREEIRQVLHGQTGINADLRPEDIDGLSRSKTLTIAFDEKLNRRAVGTGRLRMKALQGCPLHVMGQTWYLSDRMDIGGDLEAVLQSDIGHDGLLLVENLQTFDDLFAVDALVMGQLPLTNPLILYRGDAQGGARADAVHALVQRTDLPVVAFFDYDPAGLVMAKGLPRLNSLLAPPLPILEKAIQSRGLIGRYQEQVAKTPYEWERLRDDDRMAGLWIAIHTAGKALPQEYFHRLPASRI
ncbi:MAG: hypothetical protein PHX24_04915 [Acidithiobacillus sp.]|nr:hypothetical protein [Acidithiobacillus sp.]